MPPSLQPIGIYRLKLWLNGIEPRIWRVLEVPAAITLPRLHRAIQLLLGGRTAIYIGSRLGVPFPKSPIRTILTATGISMNAASS